MKYCTYISPIKCVAFVGLGRFFALRGKSHKWYTFRNSKPQRQIAKLQKTREYSKFRISISPDTSKVEFAFGNSKAETASRYQRGQSQNYPKLMQAIFVAPSPGDLTWLPCLSSASWLEVLTPVDDLSFVSRRTGLAGALPLKATIFSLRGSGGSDRKPTRRKLFHPYIFSGKWGGHSLWIEATQRDKQLGQDDASC